VAIAGYTNAGKSSLLNRLTGAGVLVENALFATLDPTVRKTQTPDGRIFTLTDTVGFVRHLPHLVVEAFRSTLEEVTRADLVVHVVDGSHADPEAQIASVREVFAEIGASAVPELIVVNKVDSADPLVLGRLRRREPTAVFVSALTGEGLRELVTTLEGLLPRPQIEVDVLVPFTAGRLVARVHDEGELIVPEDFTAEGTHLRARVGAGLAHELSPYSL
jgi:GTP-binding protein HflX